MRNEPEVTEITAHGPGYNIGGQIFDDSQIEALLDESEHGPSIVELVRADVFFEHGSVYIRIEDNYYQVEEPESQRTFVVVEAAPGVAGSGIDFEEL